jgi:hypothetical protein
MSKRNKDKEININLNETEIVKIIESLDRAARSEDFETEKITKKLADKLGGYLSRFNIRRNERQRKVAETAGYIDPLPTDESVNPLVESLLR